MKVGGRQKTVITVYTCYYRSKHRTIGWEKKYLDICLVELHAFNKENFEFSF